MIFDTEIDELSNLNNLKIDLQSFFYEYLLLLIFHRANWDDLLWTN